MVSISPSQVSAELGLLNQVKNGDQGALMALYERYGNLVYSLALRVLRQPSLAEEVTQDVFLKLWRQADSWDPTMGRFSSWLLTVTRNAAIDRLRKEQRRPTSDSTPLENVAHILSDESILDTAQWHDGQLLRQLMGQLPDEQRQVIELAFFYGLTHAQMAEQLGLPLGTVKTRVRLALKKLKEMWDKAHRDA